MISPPTHKAEANTQPSVETQAINDTIKQEATGDNRKEELDDDSFNSNNMFFAKSASKSELNLFERRIKTEEKMDENTKNTDESWAEQLLANETEEEPESDRSQTGKFENLSNSGTSIFQILEDVDEGNIDTSTRHRAIEDLLPPSTEYETPTIDTPIEDDFELEEESEHHAFDIASEIDEETVSQSAYLQAFELDPIEMSAPSQLNFWQSSLFWFALCIFMSVTAVVQMASFNFQHWARSSTLRPYYAQACDILNCTLPTLSAPSKIRIDSMIVVNHPSQENALLVDATLVNRAEFEQLFPRLLLSFSDQQNTLIDQFEFQPNDYVGGELAGQTLMPSQRPIHITLTIPDPGADALNYQLSLKSP